MGKHDKVSTGGSQGGPQAGPSSGDGGPPTTDRERDTDRADSSATNAEISDFEDETSDIVDDVSSQEDRKDRIEDIKQKHGDGGKSPYYRAYVSQTETESDVDQEGQDRIDQMKRKKEYRDSFDSVEEKAGGASQQELDDKRGEAYEEAFDSQGASMDDWTPTKRGVSEETRAEMEGTDGGSSDSVRQDQQSDVHGESVQPREVGETRSGQTVVATANSVEVHQGWSNAPSQGSANPTDLTTDSGGAEQELIQAAGMSQFRDEGTVDATMDPDEAESELERQVAQIQQEVRAANASEESTSSVEDRLHREHTFDKVDEGPSFGYYAEEEGDGSAESVEYEREPVMVVHGENESMTIDPNSTTTQGIETAIGEMQDFEESQEEAVDLEEKTTARERGNKQAASQSTRRAQERKEARQRARNTISPSRPAEGQPVQPNTDISDIDMVSEQGAEAAKEELGVRMATDVQGMSADEIQQEAGVNQHDAEVLARAGSALDERQEEIKQEAERLAEEIDGEFEQDDYEQIMHRETQDGYDVEEVADYLESWKGRQEIPGATHEGAGNTVEMSPPISELEPEYKDPSVESEYLDSTVDQGDLDTMPNATVQGEVVDVVGSDVFDEWEGDQFQVFWIEDDYGDVTQVTVWQDSVRYPDHVTEGGAVGAGDGRFSDLDADYGIRHDSEAVVEGDYVRMEAVSVNDESVKGADGYTISTTPFTDVKFLEPTHLEDDQGSAESGSSDPDGDSDDILDSRPFRETETGDVPTPPSSSEYQGDDSSEKSPAAEAGIGSEPSPGDESVDPDDIDLGDGKSIFEQLREHDDYDVEELNSFGGDASNESSEADSSN